MRAPDGSAWWWLPARWVDQSKATLEGRIVDVHDRLEEFQSTKRLGPFRRAAPRGETAPIVSSIETLLTDHARPQFYLPTSPYFDQPIARATTTTLTRPAPASNRVRAAELHVAPVVKI